MELFPDNIAARSDISLETIAAALSFFYEQVHLYHWQTTSYAEHEALGGFYGKLVDFKDEIVEKLMGYESKRPSSFKIAPLQNYKAGCCRTVVEDVKVYSQKLRKWAASRGYEDIENISQSLSGEASKVLYLLTLS